MPTALVWTPEEDEELQRLVDEFGAKKWALIASKLRSKSSKQCRRRWKNFLSINAKTCSWSTEEDARLLAAHRELGNKWTEISKIFGDRTDNAVKNRWHALVRKHQAVSGTKAGRGGAGPPAAMPDAKRARTMTGAGLTMPAGLGMTHHAHGMYGAAPQYPMPGQAYAYQPAPQYMPPTHHRHGFPRAVSRHDGGGQVLPSPFDQTGGSMASEYGANFDRGVPAAPPPVGNGAAPLSISVSRELLTPWEQELATQVNAMGAPVHIDMVPAGEFGGGGAQGADAPLRFNELPPDPITARPSWRRFIEGTGGLSATGPEGVGGGAGPGAIATPGIAELVSWLSQSVEPPGPDPAGSPVSKRMTRSASKELQNQRGGGLVGPARAAALPQPHAGPAQLTEEHRSLLRRLMSRGLESRGSWDVGRLLSIDLEPHVGAGDGLGGTSNGMTPSGTPPLVPTNGGAPPRRAPLRGEDARSPRSDPMLRTRGSWRKAGSLGTTPELTPMPSFDLLGSNVLSMSHRLKAPSGASAEMGGVQVNPTFSSMELQLLVDALLPRAAGGGTIPR